VDAVKLVWNPFSPEARALTAEQRGDYGQALHWYAKAKNGEELVAERFSYGLPACPLRHLFVAAACALIQVERTALRISQDAGASSRVTSSLTHQVEDAADALWRRAHRIGHASAEVSGSVLDALYEQERVDLQKLVQSIKVFHSDLICLQMTGSSPLQDQAARFVHVTNAARSLLQQAEEDE
jgi:hypothetical protein